MIDREPLERDPKTGCKPETAALRNLGARSGSCSLASALEWHMVYATVFAKAAGDPDRLSHW
jgi:hypothetical protein